MKYQVILFLDESRNKSYYHSYVESEDVLLGNIECTELPAYQDINKARACYWDTDALQWIFDEEKYAEIVAQIEAERQAAEQARLEAEATPTNLELADCAIELGNGQSILEDAVAELANKYANLEERVAAIENEKNGGES